MDPAHVTMMVAAFAVAAFGLVTALDALLSPGGLRGTPPKRKRLYSVSYRRCRDLRMMAAIVSARDEDEARRKVYAKDEDARLSFVYRVREIDPSRLGGFALMRFGR